MILSKFHRANKNISVIYTLITNITSGPRCPKPEQANPGISENFEFSFVFFGEKTRILTSVLFFLGEETRILTSVLYFFGGVFSGFLISFFPSGLSLGNLKLHSAASLKFISIMWSNYNINCEPDHR